MFKAAVLQLFWRVCAERSFALPAITAEVCSLWLLQRTNSAIVPLWITESCLCRDDDAVDGFDQDPDEVRCGLLFSR